MSGKEQIKNANIPQMNINRLVDELTTAYCNIINANVPIRKFPSVMLWGAPGVGKSQAVRQIGKEIESQTGKKVHITDVRLLLFNPIDLRGIPTSNADKTLAVWLKPQIFQMDESDSIVNILFLMKFQQRLNLFRRRHIRLRLTEQLENINFPKTA